ncbi:MAG: hypothetical protein ACI8TP_001820 [Acidimicrobiales bacterium]|jgi:hypothetical protein
MRRLPALLVALSLMLSACASTTSRGYDTADQVLARLAEQPDEAVANEAPDLLASAANNDCVVETRQDEYGLEFEVCVGGTERPSSDQSDGPSASTTRAADTDVVPLVRFDELIALVPAGAAATALRDAGVIIAAGDAACSRSAAAWTEQMGRVTSALLDTAPLVANAAELTDYRGSLDARELAQAFLERVALQTGCVDPASDPPPTSPTARGALTDVTSASIAAVEPVYQALRGDNKSPLFYHPDELAHRLWMRETGQVAVLVAGTSQTMLGIEPDLLAEALSVSVGSSALPGALAEVQQQWLPQVAALVHPSVIVWGIGTLDMVAICEPDGRAEEFRRLSTLKDDLFYALPWADGIDQFELLVGLPGSQAYVGSPTFASLDRRFPNPNGDAFEFAQPDPVQLQQSLEQFQSPFQRGDFCTDRVALIGEVIAELTAAGHRVVIFGMPLAPVLEARYVNGPDALDQLVDDAAAEVFVPAGAHYAGMLTGADTNDLWYDVVHPTRSGGEELTAQLAAALLAAGL